MASHTPGPWHISSRSGQGQDVYGGSELVAEAFAREEDVRRANARLIAAAPELLAEAKAFIAWINGAVGDDTELDLATQLLKLQIAITKAEGRDA